MNLPAWNVRLGAPGGAWVAGLIALGVAVVVVREIVRLRDGAPPIRRLVLSALRVVTAFAVLALALQPQWVQARLQQVDGRLAVLVDVSRSMTVGEESRTRADKVLALLARWREAPGAEPLWYAFGRGIKALPGGDPGGVDAFHEDDTRIRAALEAVVEEQGDALGAIVLVSDGVELGPPRVDEKAPWPVRVHTVAVGDAGDNQDDAITEVRADRVSFLRQEAKIEVALQSTRLAGAPLVVTLRQEDRVVVEREATLGMDGQARVELPFTPGALGRAVYTVSIPLAADDPVPENNERAFLVRVERDKLRVLLVSGSPSWETRFLRAFLKGDPAIDLIAFFILRTPSDMTLAAQDDLSLIPFPTAELFEQHLTSFDIVILQDFDYGPYRMHPYLSLLRDHVRAGGSLVMAGGARSFGAGDYAGTALAEVLPVAIDAPFDPVTAPFLPGVAPGMERHPLVELSLDPRESVRRWSELPALFGVNRFGALRPGGQALLVHPEARGADGTPMPVLAVGEAGAGRVIALAMDATWRWGFTAGGVSGDPSTYERFWDRALRWLSRDPLLDPSRVTLDRESYAPAAMIEARVLARDERYRPLADTKLELRMRDLSGKALPAQPVTTDASGHASAAFRAPAEPGGYALGLARQGEPALFAEEAFVVDAGGRELADPRARSDSLRAIAEASGGEHFPSVERAPALDRFERTRSQVFGTTVSAPFASVWYFVLVVALLALEWALRRTWGLR